MAAEFITNEPFILKGKAARRFADAIEDSLNGPGLASNLTTKAVELHGEELKEFIKKTWEEHAKRKL